ncbi:mitochondrial antiviral-signaling protein [Colius striatus]|uniref:mitochondrial antiviral-signaling protein n=1 Tax=Colius striatus TaxID=57412 RepID=UPI002B1D83A5|nr:mitochondrial antiviral-signaling protein [Colius striatus]XP_061849814.1 mitochondrial antiviral-signaling protein [Colius striatus]
MGFAEDKVYDYILKNLRTFSNIRVASLADSLSCLTDADRDELHAREEMRGSQATIYRFYQHLRCRDGWVLDLIKALQQNNAGQLAEELQHVYDSWQIRAPASLSPAASSTRPAVSVGAQPPCPGLSPAPASAAVPEQPRCAVPAHPPSLPPSTQLDARAPVQESLPKSFPEQESLQSPLPGSMVRAEVSDRHSGEGHLSHPTMRAPGAGSVVVPPATPPEQGPAWLSRQQHPVCVDNGCFGNRNHLHRGAPGLGLGGCLQPRAVGAACRPEQPRNQPEENFYLSTEAPPRLEETVCSRGPQPPASLPQNPSVPAREPTGSFVDVRSPLLIQQQFDVEQKQVGMLPEHRDGDPCLETSSSVSTLVARDASLSCDTLKPPKQESKLPVGKTASSIPSVLMKEKVVPASAEPLPRVAGSSEGTSTRMASRVSSATSVWASGSNEEKDVELSKAAVLIPTAVESPEAASRCLSSQGPNGPSFGLSDSFTFCSDPLLVSTDSSCSGGALPRVSSGFLAPAAHTDSGEEEAAGESTSLGTHEVYVAHYPSTQLEAGSDLQDGDGPLGTPPVFEGGTATSSSKAKVPSGDSKGPSLPYIIPAVGIAVISAVAFLVYARLQK